jgi:hypothetical protein
MNQLAGALLRLISAKLGLLCPEHFAAKGKSDIEELPKGKKVFSGVPTERELELQRVSGVRMHLLLLIRPLSFSLSRAS